MKVKIKKGDTIEVVTGHRGDKGKRGEVIKVDTRRRRVTIQGINVHKKHQRQYQSRGRTMQPGIVELEVPIDISNVMVVCPKCDKPTRIGIDRDGDEPQRICKKCGGKVD
ncbi:MAG: 50S ribosomal protein L24 [Kiloniellales bacterium]|nr:50S ribosomal protein L24 [Kiloniellales bacterium]